MTNDEKKPTSLKQVALGFVLLAIIGVAAYYLLIVTDAKVAIAILGLAGAVLTAAFQYRYAKIRETEARLFSEKSNVYVKIIDLIFDLMQSQKTGEIKSQDELVSRLWDIKKRLFVWGGSETILCLDKLGDLPNDGDDSEKVARLIQWLGDLLAHIRSDLGHQDPKDAGTKMALGILVANDRASISARLAV